MKRYSFLLILLFIVASVNAQFGYRKKADIEKFKDSRLVVVLFPDSAYSASIQYAVEKYWNFNGGFLFVPDTALKPYLKGDYAFLVFSKGKNSKIKAKVNSSDLDMNGLQVVSKWRRRSKEEEVIASAFCRNRIDTIDWLPEMIRGVQLLNNYFNIAIEARDDRSMSESFLKNNYPTDKSMISNKKCLFELRTLALKGKEDAAVLLDGEYEEVYRDDINKAIIEQDAGIYYYFTSFGEKNCNRMFISAQNSELLYYSSASADKCECTAKELREMRELRDKASK
jgi:hypothetical protein